MLGAERHELPSSKQLPAVVCLLGIRFTWPSTRALALRGYTSPSWLLTSHLHKCLAQCHMHLAQPVESGSGASVCPPSLSSIHQVQK
jgi:hypothetical protein